MSTLEAHQRCNGVMLQGKSALFTFWQQASTVLWELMYLGKMTLCELVFWCPAREIIKISMTVTPRTSGGHRGVIREPADEENRAQRSMETRQAVSDQHELLCRSTAAFEANATVACLV